MKIRFKNTFSILICLTLCFLGSNKLFSDENIVEPGSISFSYLNLQTSISELDYYDFIRDSIITQPEYLYANLKAIEKDEDLKYSRRQRFPELSVQVINDQVLERKVVEQTSLRKRQDDSFDAAVELSQPIYSGGTINAQVRKALHDKSFSITEKENALSTLILDANLIYLNAIKSNYLYEYGTNLISEIDPFLEKVRERVEIGISDPIELALFSIKYNALKSRVQILKTQKDRDLGIFEYFFGTKYQNIYFPNVFVPLVENNNNQEAYNVSAAKLQLKSAKEDTNITKGEFRPQFGFRTRYTVYDIKDNENDTDWRGGIYFSMPLFTFGRSTAKISSFKAKENASRMNIDIERKDDDVRETEIVNLVRGSINTRQEVYSSYEDTKNQRRIIRNRLDSTTFSPESYANSSLEEINLLEEFINIEINLLAGYFSYLHQNQKLNSIIRVEP
ncbi:MAG: TolC family protein [Pseudomonadota bacterium]|nr:TolC family protein [Pseudomonadota bacterium]